MNKVSSFQAVPTQDPPPHAYLCHFPWASKDPLPAEVGFYEAAPWAAGNISLLDFLRKTNKSGQIAGWVKKLHAKSASILRPVEEFAAGSKVAGETAVAADMLSMFNDC